MEQLDLKVKQLERQLAEVKTWMQERNRQQISFPLDINSQDIIQDKALIFNDLNTSTVTADQSIGVIVNGKKYQINVKKPS